jgi:hypothetical protein
METASLKFDQSRAMPLQTAAQQARAIASIPDCPECQNRESSRARWIGGALVPMSSRCPGTRATARGGTGARVTGHSRGAARAVPGYVTESSVLGQLARIWLHGRIATRTWWGGTGESMITELRTPRPATAANVDGLAIAPMDRGLDHPIGPTFEHQTGGFHHGRGA